MDTQIRDVRTIQDCQRFLKYMYQNANENRSQLEYYGYLIQSTGYISKNEFAKNRNHEKDIQFFIKAFSWLLSLGNHYDIDVADSYIMKYPKICGYCLSSTCKCHKTGKKPPKTIPAWKAEDELDHYYRSAKSELKDIDSVWIKNNISSIYPNNEVIWHFGNKWYHFAKLHEELSELHQAMQKYEKGDFKIEILKLEIADVFAWLMSIFHLTLEKHKLEDLFIDYYRQGCPVCLNKVCTCRKMDNRIIGVVNPSEIQHIINLLEEIKDLNIVDKDIINDKEKNLQAAKVSGKESVMKKALEDTVDGLENVERGIKAATGSASKVKQLISTIYQIANALLN